MEPGSRGRGRAGPPGAGLAALLALAGHAAPAPQEPAAAFPLGLPAEALAALRPDPAEALLGRELFFDPVLSRDRSLACASCHRPEHGFADPVPLSRGVGGALTVRNAPTLYNRALGRSFLWDGRAATLEEQVLLPIEEAREMALPLDEALARLGADPRYAARFREVHGREPDREGLARSLAAFVRGLLHGDTAVDRFRAGEIEALTRAERTGMWLFESRGGCWHCHSGPNFTDEGFHNTGVGVRDGAAEPGRGAITGLAEDRGRFKTPTLRGLAESAPYMHDGSLGTLEEVVAFYRGGGGGNPDLDPGLAPLELTDEEAADLVAFLRALSRRSAPAPGEDTFKKY